MNCLRVRSNPRSVANVFDSMFEDILAPMNHRWSETSTAFVPRVDVVENENNISLTFELPGMKKEDIKVTLNDDILTVSGERKFSSEEKDSRFVTREIRSGSFSRSFTLPDTVNHDGIKADYNDGLLEIKLAKLEEVKPKEIEVKVS